MEKSLCHAKLCLTTAGLKKCTIQYMVYEHKFKKVIYIIQYENNNITLLIDKKFYPLILSELF